MDESEAYNHGHYETYEDALIAAKTIVDEFFEHNWKSGFTADYLLGQYSLYGEEQNSTFSTRVNLNILFLLMQFILD